MTDVAESGRATYVRSLGFLARCAHPLPAPAVLAREFAHEADSIGDWAMLADLAEHHAVGPLLLAHLRAAAFEPPRWVKRRLHADLTRHRHENRVRLAVLARVLDAFATADLRVVLLKGAAVAPLIYGDLGLRPMSDLDLLVDENRAIEARQLLLDLGFEASPLRRVPLRHHHLPAVVRWVDGVPVQIEIHRNAFARGRRPRMRLGPRSPDLLEFQIEGRRAQTLAPTELIWHLCRHLTTPCSEVRLISIADIVGAAATFARQIDWTRVARDYPFVLRTLQVLDCLVPRSAGGGSGPRGGLSARLRGIGVRYTGWPICAARHLRGHRERLRLLGATVAPPEWWLRLTYGAGVDRSGLWFARGRHAAFVIGAAVRRCSDLLLEQPSIHRRREQGDLSPARRR